MTLKRLVTCANFISFLNIVFVKDAALERFSAMNRMATQHQADEIPPPQHQADKIPPMEEERQVLLKIVHFWQAGKSIIIRKNVLVCF